MNPRTLLETLRIAEKLKDTTRHCYTSGGRHESVAEHCWMVALMAFFLRDAFPEADMDKVIRMCLIHDLGEAFTGDIPAFHKSDRQEEREAVLLSEWVSSLPEPYAGEMTELYLEMSRQQTVEAKIYKALDGLEAVIQHNFSDLSTWLPLEYELNQTYANDKVAFSSYLMELRQQILQDTLDKIHEGDKGASST